MASEIIGDDSCFEIHVATPLTVCEARDPTGLYKRARKVEIAGLTGVGSIYEMPEARALVINTVEVPGADAVNRMLGLLRTPA